MPMLPPFSSMHLVNCWVAPAQLLPQLLFCCWAGAAAWTGSAGALEPPKRPPIAWPMEDPIATPL